MTFNVNISVNIGDLCKYRFSYINENDTKFMYYRAITNAKAMNKTPWLKVTLRLVRKQYLRTSQCKFCNTYQIDEMYI